MRSIVCCLLFTGSVIQAWAQGQVSVSFDGVGAAAGPNRFSLRGAAKVSGLEDAIVSGGGTYSAEEIGNDTTVLVAGIFTLIFPSGGTMVGRFTAPAGILIPNVGNFNTAKIDFFVTGGTGKYDGARGAFRNMNGSGTAAGTTGGTFHIEGTGTLTVGFWTLPQLAFGDGWYTALYFANSGTSQAVFRVNFVGNGGAPLSVSGLGTSADVTIPPGGSIRLEAPNAGSLTQGYATATLPEGVTGYGVFRQTVSGVPDQEAVVPLVNGALSSMALIFDDTNFTTAVAIANPSNQDAVVTITAASAAGGNLGSGTVRLAAKTKTAVVLRSVTGLAGVAGVRGVVRFQAEGGSVAVLGLRFYGAAFTSIPATEP